MEEQNSNMDPKQDSPKRKKSPWRLVIALAVIALIVAGGLNYLSQRHVIGEDSPPSLTKQALFKGQAKDIEEYEGFLHVTDETIDDFGDLQCTNPQNIKRGLNYFYLTEDKTVSEIMYNNVAPVKDVSHLLFLMYSPGEASRGITPGYYAYPKGWYGGTVLIQNPDEFVVPAYRPFIFVSVDNRKAEEIEVGPQVKGCFQEPEQKPEYPFFNIFLGADESGWVMVSAEKCSDFGPYINRIRQVWVLNEDNDFEKVENEKIVQECQRHGTYVAWLQLNEGLSTEQLLEETQVEVEIEEEPEEEIEEQPEEEIEEEPEEEIEEEPEEEIEEEEPEEEPESQEVSLDGPGYYLSPASAEFNLDCPIAVDIYIDTDGQNVNAGDVFINYDPSKLEILDQDDQTPGVQILKGNLFQVYAGESDIENGQIRSTAFNFQGTFSGEGIWGTVVFKAKPGVSSADLTFDFTPGETTSSNIADESANPILNDVSNASYTFTNGSCS